MSDSSDHRDISRIGVDPDAFEAFYRAHVEAVQRFVARRVGDPLLAADLTVDVFLAVIESADSYCVDRGEPVCWLFGVARNIVANELRSEARKVKSTERVAARRLLDDDDIARLEDRIDAEANARQLYQAMDDLGDTGRAVLELVAVDGLSVQDAAKALGIRPATARVRLHRARRALRRDINQASTDSPLPLHALLQKEPS